MAKTLPPHGNVRRYNDFKCRCDLCKDAKAEYRRTKMPKYERLTIEQGRELGLPEPEHGTTSSYNNWSCRCDLCVAAASADSMVRMKEFKETASERMLAGELHPTHGTWSTYCAYSCRCDECKAAASEYGKQYYLTRKANSAKVDS
jgi:hypothetical protein